MKRAKQVQSTSVILDEDFGSKQLNDTLSLEDEPLF